METFPERAGERQAAAAFTQQSTVFDQLYGADKIISYKRARVRQHLLRYLPSSASILELNAGTGEDAIFLAQQGHRVHATDISGGMQQQLVQKTAALGLGAVVTAEQCSFTQLKSLAAKGPYDHIFSNFAGLNCTGDLNAVLVTFSDLLRPGGCITLVMLPKFCLWEFLLVFRGLFTTATRRFFSARGRKAKIGDAAFTCWYYSPRFVIKQLKDSFRPLSLEGLCTVVPPSYIAGFGDKYPRLFRFLCRMENRMKARWPWKYIGDYYIISLKKM